MDQDVLPLLAQKAIRAAQEKGGKDTAEIEAIIQHKVNTSCRSACLLKLPTWPTPLTSLYRQLPYEFWCSLQTSLTFSGSLCAGVALSTAYFMLLLKFKMLWRPHIYISTRLRWSQL